MKNTKAILKGLFLIICASVILLASVGISPTLAHARTQSNAKYLYNLTEFCVSGDRIYVYDANLGKIKQVSIPTKQETASIVQEGVVALFFKNETLFALVEQEETIKLQKIAYTSNSLAVASVCDLTSLLRADENYSSIRDADIFAIDETSIKLFILYNSNTKTGKIMQFEILLSTFEVASNAEYIPNPLTLSTTDADAYNNFANEKWQQIEAISENELVIVNQKYIYTVSSTSQVSKVYRTETEAETIDRVLCSPSGAYLLSRSTTEGKQLVSLKAGTITVLDSLVIDEFACYLTSVDTKLTRIYLLNTEANEIGYLALNEEETGIAEEYKSHISNKGYSNPATYPSSSNVNIKKTTELVSMWTYPFGTKVETSIPKDSQVMIIANEDADNYVNYTYCMFTSANANKNFYGYIETSKLGNINLTTTEKKIFGKKRAKIYKYPSLNTDEDGINAIIYTLQKETEITQIIEENMSIYAKAENITMLKITLPAGTVGYINKTEIEEIVPISTPKVNTNAQIKKNVTLYEDAEGYTATNITLEKGMRIRVPNRISYNKEYTKVIFNNADGQEITGYIQTSVIKMDGLSALQIVGIVLLSLNVCFLFIIISIKKRLVKD